MLPLTRHGWREMLLGSVLLIGIGAAMAWVWCPLASVVLPLLVFLFAFFRDPHRPIPQDPHAMVSPADGTVSDITELPDCPLLGGPAVRVGIFLSVFNVHVNRSPCPGRVASVIYQRGKFINALRHDEASSENESNTLVLVEPGTGRTIALVKQIVGLIARRIVCSVAVSDVLQRGQRIGMIKFGSRTELYIPKWLNPCVVVKIGQKVRGARDVIATVGAELKP